MDEWRDRLDRVRCDSECGAERGAYCGSNCITNCFPDSLPDRSADRATNPLPDSLTYTIADTSVCPRPLRGKRRTGCARQLWQLWQCQHGRSL